MVRRKGSLLKVDDVERKAMKLFTEKVIYDLIIFSTPKQLSPADPVSNMNFRVWPRYLNYRKKICPLCFPLRYPLTTLPNETRHKRINSETLAVDAASIQIITCNLLTPNPSYNSQITDCSEPFLQTPQARSRNMLDTRAQKKLRDAASLVQKAIPRSSRQA